MRALVLAATLALAPPAGAGEPAAPDEPGPEARRPTAAEMTVDALIVRPLMLARTALGAGVFVVGLPFSIPGGNVAESADRLVLEPAKHTFTRPLGELARPAER